MQSRSIYVSIAEKSRRPSIAVARACPNPQKFSSRMLSFPMVVFLVPNRRRLPHKRASSNQVIYATKLLSEQAFGATHSHTSKIIDSNKSSHDLRTKSIDKRIY